MKPARTSITASWILVTLVGWAVALPAVRRIYRHLMIERTIPGWVILLMAAWTILALGQ